MFDGKLQVYRRGARGTFHCAARVKGVRYRATTGEKDFDSASLWAEEWYLDLRGKVRAGQIIKKERTFKEAWELYSAGVRVLARGMRTPLYLLNMELRVNRHILPYFGAMPVKDVTKGVVYQYYVQRVDPANNKSGKSPARTTMSQEFVHIRQVLKHAEMLGWIGNVPNLSMPYMTQSKKGRRAWFSPEEYVQLYTATKARAAKAPRHGWDTRYADLHDFVLFQANTGMRPDETIQNLEVRDVKFEREPGKKTEILAIDVRGKVGTGYCKSLPGAVHPYRRVLERRQIELEIAAAELDGELKGLRHGALIKARRKLVADLKSKIRPFTQELPPTTRVFPRFDRETFNNILDEQGLKFDRDGKRRTAYSLRHTYISMRLLDGANHYQLAINCRTSVKMIEEHYAAHIRDRVDVAAVNRVKASRKSRAAILPKMPDTPVAPAPVAA
jgi:hypothetical protein